MKKSILLISIVGLQACALGALSESRFKVDALDKNKSTSQQGAAQNIDPTIINEQSVIVEDVELVPVDVNAGTVANTNIQQGLALRYPSGAKMTTSGEPYDPSLLTAAHPNFPIGSQVIVRGIENSSQVFVRINDRQEFSNDKIIRLSQAAFDALGGSPTAYLPVQIELYEDATNIQFDSAPASEVAPQSLESIPADVILESPLN